MTIKYTKASKKEQQAYAAIAEEFLEAIARISARQEVKGLKTNNGVSILMSCVMKLMAMVATDRGIPEAQLHESINICMTESHKILKEKRK